MSLFHSTSTIHITCSLQNTPYLNTELKKLGYTPSAIGKNYIQIAGTLTDCMILNLQLRTAHRVLYFLFETSIYSIHEVYDITFKNIEWENIIPSDGYVSIDAISDSHEVRNSMFLNLKIKDAIVDRIKEKKGKRPDSGSEKRGAVISIFWKQNRITYYIDTSGESIAKHGYRLLPHQAPLQEALAASVIMATDWDVESPFINPMCGSGTLAIEAALMAAQKPPGLIRGHFAFMHILGYDVSTWHRMRSKQEQIAFLQSKKPIIVASDIDPKAVKAAQKNAQKAGVDRWIRFQICSFEDTFIPDTESGIVIINPEYGTRLGEDERISEALYAKIGTFFKQRCIGFTGYVFTGNFDYAKKIGLKPSKRIEFFNAKIDCRLSNYELYSGSKRVDKLQGKDNES